MRIPWGARLADAARKWYAILAVELAEMLAEWQEHCDSVGPGPESNMEYACWVWCHALDRRCGAIGKELVAEGLGFVGEPIEGKQQRPWQ